MKIRVLILAAILAACAVATSAQGNCSYGSYAWGDYNTATQVCSTTTIFVPLTDTRTASEWCTAGQGQAVYPPGTAYWNAVPPSVDIGNGQRERPTLGGGNFDCWPRMNFYEVDGGKPYPNQVISDTSANRFFTKHMTMGLEYFLWPQVVTKSRQQAHTVVRTSNSAQRWLAKDRRHRQRHPRVRRAAIAIQHRTPLIPVAVARLSWTLPVTASHSRVQPLAQNST